MQSSHLINISGHTDINLWIYIFCFAWSMLPIVQNCPMCVYQEVRAVYFSFHEECYCFTAWHRMSGRRHILRMWWTFFPNQTSQLQTHKVKQGQCFTSEHHFHFDCLFGFYRCVCSAFCNISSDSRRPNDKWITKKGLRS